MKRGLLISFAILLLPLLVSCGSGKKAASGNVPEDTGYDIYLLIGQSNMAGRGRMLAQDTLKPIDGVWLFGPEGKPVPARNPLNQYSTIGKEYSKQQICPGTGFSQEMRKRVDRDILLVVNARGGTTLDEWMPGTHYYTEAVNRTLDAKKYGTLKGILWHQGCGDTAPAKVKVYLEKLSRMVASLRKDLGVDETVPFIAGELARWRPIAAGFNEMIHGISDVIPNSSYVSSEGCSQLKSDRDPHFGREGQLLIGKRYAKEIYRLNKKYETNK